MKHYSNNSNSMNQGSEGGSRFRKGNLKSFNSSSDSSFNSRSGSMNNFGNSGRAKPYSRAQARGRPTPLMSNSGSNYDDYENYDNDYNNGYDNDYDNDYDNQRNFISMNKNKRHIQRTGNGVKMRGLPFKATEDDIREVHIKD